VNNFVIDASVAVKWFLKEEETEAAMKILEQLTFFFAPDLFLIEIDSVLTKRVRQGSLAVSEAADHRKQFRRLPCEFINYSQIEEFAFCLATEFPVTIYEATYLATAVDYDAKLYTADLRFARAVSATPFSDYLRSIGG
jgi:predicted nucleic acid-binding protein